MEEKQKPEDASNSRFMGITFWIIGTTAILLSIFFFIEDLELEWIVYLVVGIFVLPPVQPPFKRFPKWLRILCWFLLGAVAGALFKTKIIPRLLTVFGG